MQAHSPTYSPYSTVRYIDLSVSFGLADTQASENGVPTASNSMYPTQLSQPQLFEEMSYKINTLEPSMMLLDGSGKIMPSDLTGVVTGWWSGARSNGEAVFDVPPTLTYNFSVDVKCVGFMLLFDKDYEIASEVNIVTYDASGNVVSQGTFANDKTRMAVELRSEGIRSVVFTFNKTWLPYRTVRLAGVLFGIIQTFNADSIVSASLVQEVSPAMDAFPSNQFVYVFDNLDQDYNLVNPEGLYSFLQDNQTITVIATINGEEIFLGDYLFQNSAVENGGITASIVGGDYAISLEGSIYNGGATGTWTLLQAVEAIKANSGLDFAVDIPSDIGSRVINKAIPENTNSREALRMAAQAARCVMYFDRSNTLTARDFSIAGDANANVTADNAQSLSGISVATRINTVVLTVDNSFADTKAEFIASELSDGEAMRIKSVSNPLAYDGQAVADWLLSIYKRKARFNIPFRGNPALDPIDTLKIDTIFGGTVNANISKIVTSYNGGLAQTITAIGAN